MADQIRSDQGGQGGQGGVQKQDDRHRNPADNLSREDRVRGGERSAAMQHRDQRGQFAGRKNKAEEDRNRQQGGRAAGSGAATNR
jgi:hypothetical protein